MTWPEPGRCGACTRPARRYPSGRWEHEGRPCALRSQGTFAAADVPVRNLLVFVPDGEALFYPNTWRDVVTRVDDTGFPIELGLISPQQQAAHWDRVREQLRADAEGEPHPD